MATMVTCEKRKACSVLACLVLVGTCLTGCHDCPKELKVTGPGTFGVSGHYKTDDEFPGTHSVYKQVSWEGPGLIKKDVHYIRHWHGKDPGWGLANHASDNDWVAQVEGGLADCPNATGWKWDGDDDKFNVEVVAERRRLTSFQFTESTPLLSHLVSTYTSDHAPAFLVVALTMGLCGAMVVLLVKRSQQKSDLACSFNGFALGAEGPAEE